MALHLTLQADGSVPLTAPEAISKRRSTPVFDPTRPLPDALLKSILHLATLAPSSFNLQPWRFLVVRSRANREKLSAASYGQSKIIEAPVVVIVLGYHTPQKTHLGPMIRTQVELGTITGDVAKGLAARAERFVDNVPNVEAWTTRSTMLAAATLMIAAESLGVNSAPMEGFEPEKVRSSFGIPDDHSVCCLVALGFAAPGIQKPFPGRFGLDEVSYLEHFGGPWTLGD